MNDVLEELFEMVEEEIDQGVSLVVSASAIPRDEGAVSTTGGTWTSRQTETLPWVEMEDVSLDIAPNWAEGVVSLPGGMESRLERGRSVTGAVGETGGDASLIQQMERLERNVSMAQVYTLRGHGGDAPTSAVEGAGRGSATSFAVANGTRRQSVATVETARTVDRAIERDARRYDGGFLLG